MPTMLTNILLLTAAIGSGLIGGLFFAFSNFVMRALDQRPPAQAVSAMQAINVTVLNPLFLSVFMGTALLSLVLAVTTAFARWDTTARYALAGALLYGVGSFLVTIVFNVPLNNHLATVSPDSGDVAQQWRSYRSAWTIWNHVRTICSLLATTTFIAAGWSH